MVRRRCVGLSCREHGPEIEEYIKEVITESKQPSIKGNKQDNVTNKAKYSQLEALNIP